VSNSQTDASLSRPSPEQFDQSAGGIGAYDTPLGITNPPHRRVARRRVSQQIRPGDLPRPSVPVRSTTNYNQLGEGILEYVGPAGRAGVAGKSPLSDRDGARSTATCLSTPKAS